MFSLPFWIIAFIVAITIHEASHAWMADRLGDPTPRLTGRLSLNPLVHYDPVGTTLLLLLVFLRAVTQNPGIIPFGWAKPVRIDPYNLARPRRDAALISLAGPGANLLLAFLLSLILKLALSSFSPLTHFSLIFIPIITLNVALAIFNLIPIHPLDGGKILVGILPFREARELDLFLNRYGVILLFLLIFPTLGGFSPISAVVSPIINLLLNFLIPGSPII